MIQDKGSATRDQVVALMALYSKWEAHSLPDGADPRAARLAWASENTGHDVPSFSDLTRDEARALIDILKGSMGQPLGEKANPWRRVYSRDRAQAAGTAGRRGALSSVIQMASPDDLARVHELVSRLDWTQEQFNAWLKSPRSPLGATDQVVIRTADQANRIYWALKAMLVRAGRWHAAPRKKSARGSSTADRASLSCAPKGKAIAEGI